MALSGFIQSKQVRLALAAILLLAAFMFIEIFEALHESATADEPTYVEAGYNLLHGRPSNLEHPPAAKLLFGISDSLFASQRPTADHRGQLPWIAGRGLAPARGTTLAITLLLTVLIFIWARSFGIAAGIAAITLFLLDPTVLAHGHLATLDIPSAATFALACYLGERLDERITFKRFVIAASAVSLALLTKWAALALIPALPLAALTGAMARSEGVKHGLRRAGLQLLAVAAGLGTMVFAYVTFLSWTDLTEGVRFQQNHAAAGHLTFLLGKIGDGERLGYFPFALAVKAPLAFLPLVALGSLSAVRRAFIWVPAGVFFTAALFSPFDIGIRYLLPMYPMLYVLAGVGFLRLWSSRRLWKKFGAVVLVAGFVASSLAAFPRHIEYFNELAAFSSWRGHDWLNDSNADWGQGLKYLSNDLEKLQIRRVCLDYFGSGILISTLQKSPGSLSLYGSKAQLGPPGSCRYAAVSSLFLFTRPEYAPLRAQRPLNSGPIFVFYLGDCQTMQQIPPCVRKG